MYRFTQRYGGFTERISKKYRYDRQKRKADSAGISVAENSDRAQKELKSQASVIFDDNNYIQSRFSVDG
jgi:hypothetical protein